MQCNYVNVGGTHLFSAKMKKVTNGLVDFSGLNIVFNFWSFYAFAYRPLNFLLDIKTVSERLKIKISKKNASTTPWLMIFLKNITINQYFNAHFVLYSVDFLIQWFSTFLLAGFPWFFSLLFLLNDLWTEIKLNLHDLKALQNAIQKYSRQEKKIFLNNF